MKKENFIRRFLINIRIFQHQKKRKKFFYLIISISICLFILSFSDIIQFDFLDFYNYNYNDYIETDKLSFYEQMLNDPEDSIIPDIEHRNELNNLQNDDIENYEFDDSSDNNNNNNDKIKLKNNNKVKNEIDEIEEYQKIVDNLRDANEKLEIDFKKNNLLSASLLSFKKNKSKDEIKRIIKLQIFYKKILKLFIDNKPNYKFDLLDVGNNRKSSEYANDIYDNDDEVTNTPRKQNSEKIIKKDSYYIKFLNKFKGKISNNRIFLREYGKSGIANVPVIDNDNNDHPILSEEFLSNALKIPNILFNDLKRSHKNVVKNLPKKFPNKVYKGNGIVFIGGGKFSWLSLLSLENLRLSGSKLPVELMIPSEKDYEPQLCEEILPRLNAKCILLNDIFPDLKRNGFNDEYQIRGYQYKSIAILVSSFENVLLLDSDNVVVSNPDHLFESEPFISKGLILWPDFWRRMTNPLYYEIANIKLGKKRIRNSFDDITPIDYYSNGRENYYTDIPLHDRLNSIPDGSTESGQILINKSTHSGAILLSFYYNFFGPNHYYPLFSQGSKGEGDKETIIAAANFYKLPFYQVKKLVDVIGYWRHEPIEYIGVGMIQYDPIKDFENVKEYSQKVINDNSKYDELKFNEFFNKERSKPIFIHCNYPKLDPVSLRKENKLFFTKPGGKVRTRMYKDQFYLDYDFELRQWQIIRKYFCLNIDKDKEIGLKLNYLRLLGVESLDYCPFINEQIQFLKQTQSEIHIE